MLPLLPVAPVPAGTMGVAKDAAPEGHTFTALPAVLIVGSLVGRQSFCLCRPNYGFTLVRVQGRVGWRSKRYVSYRGPKRAPSGPDESRKSSVVF